MRIAVTYDNGEVFGHFGRTEQFKIYNVENDSIVSMEIMGSNGAGHEALADLLSDCEIDVLICGGIGGGAKMALEDLGIEICSGATGDADKAVEAFLKGELKNEGVNCNHHEEGHTCDGEGHSCSNCASGACGSRPGIEGKNVGKICKTHYEGTLNDGTKFDSSYDRGEPLEFICGAGMMIAGFDKAVANMEVGEVKNIHLSCDEAYGPVDPDAIFSVKFEQLPGSEELNVGEQILLSNPYGQRFPAKVVAKDEETITFDANHEMAGKELNFKIELVAVK